MLVVGFVAGLPAPLGCALRDVPEAGFAFEAILVVEAIAGLSVKMRDVAPVAQRNWVVRGASVRKRRASRLFWIEVRGARCEVRGAR
jgi:hypothetical protein